MGSCEMNGIISLLILLNLLILTCSVDPSQNKTEQDLQNRPRRHLFPTRVYSFTKHSYRTLKSGPSSRASRHFTSKPRILKSSRPPVKLVHNGPFYLNHHIYYDSSIHAHGIPVQEEVSFINSAPSIAPKLEHLYDGDRIKIPDATNHYGVNQNLDFLNIDLTQNQHIGKFEVNLPSFTVPEPNNFHNEVVKPLVQGAITDENTGNYGFTKPDHGFQAQNHHKYNEELDAIVQYLKESGDASVYGEEKPTYNEHEDKTNNRGEFVSTPNLTKHPLEDDPSKSTYDTPGAVDSYGRPVAENSKPLLDSYEHHDPQSHSTPLVNSYKEGSFENTNKNQNDDDSAVNYNFEGSNFDDFPENSNEFKNSFETFDKNVDLSNDFKVYIQKQLNSDIERLRRSSKPKDNRSENVTNPSKNMDMDGTTTIKYSNHKYD